MDQNNALQVHAAIDWASRTLLVPTSLEQSDSILYSAVLMRHSYVPTRLLLLLVIGGEGMIAKDILWVKTG